MSLPTSASRGPTSESFRMTTPRSAGTQNIWPTVEEMELYKNDLMALARADDINMRGLRWQIRSPALSSELCSSHVKGQRFNCRLRRMVTSGHTFGGFVRFRKVLDR